MVVDVFCCLACFDSSCLCSIRFWYLGIFPCSPESLQPIPGKAHSCAGTIVSRLAAIEYVRLTNDSFDVSPVGRMLNGLVSDISTADEKLPGSIRRYIDQSMAFLSAGLVVVLFMPYFLPFAVTLLFLYFSVARRYRNLTRDILRFERYV